MSSLVKNWLLSTLLFLGATPHAHASGGYTASLISGELLVEEIE